MEDEVDVFHGPLETVTVADVADQETEVDPARMPLALVELFGLVATKDADHARLELQQSLDKSRTDRPRSPGHKDPLSG
jgi:hypothetical protein